ncbi:hypothetical protein GCM10010218_12630 [Streptomyces mashuensis]|uniref:Uncharacterized protein n=1 Tax=Streptomyces mashuensis TaxID=33904 RepID=A0A919EA11_9ACTN|nr:hypothetical protein [Streptomyces mashuensis]GHF33025.1 hypothetical protein GCM10010218_12630 [Streptomyces mashuensis]
MATATAPVTAAPALAHRVAERLPHRDGNAWTVAPYAAWWTTRPAARLTQAGRPGALILAEHPWRTEIAWQLDDREPYEPDLILDRIAPGPVVRETLRLVLPRMDDVAALAYADRPADARRARLRHLNLIGSAVRAHGPATVNRTGSHPNSDLVEWSSQGVRYAVTLIGANPACDLSVSGPVADVEQVLPLFLPERAAETSRFPLRDVRTRLGRRVAAHLVQYTPVDQLDDGELTFGAATGPFGYVCPPADPAARIRDTTPVVAELHGVGVDHLVHLAARLAS